MWCCVGGNSKRSKRRESRKEQECAIQESLQAPEARYAASTQARAEPAASEHAELSCRLFSGELAQQSSFQLKDDQGKQLQEQQLFLARAQLLCDITPALKTMFTQDGHVLAQNSSSKSYYGELVGSTMWSTNRHGLSAAAAHSYGQLRGPLAELFATEDDEKQLPSFLEHMESGQTWRSMIRVQPCLASVLQQRNLPGDSHISNAKAQHTAEAQQAPDAQQGRTSFEFGPVLKNEMPAGRASMWPTTGMQPSSRLQAQLTNKAMHSSSHSFAECSLGSKSRGQLLLQAERKGQAPKQGGPSHLASEVQPQEQQQHHHQQQTVGPQRRITRTPSRVTFSGLASSNSSRSSADEATQPQGQQRSHRGHDGAQTPLSPPLVLPQQPMSRAHQPIADLQQRQSSASQLLSLALSTAGARRRQGIPGRRRLSSSDGVLRLTTNEKLMVVGSGSDAGAGGGASQQQDGLTTKARARHHELELSHVFDPVTNQKVHLLVQTDVTEQVEREHLLSQLVEGQLAILSQIFPRHIIDALSSDGEITASNISDTSYNHSNCTILFLDLVGFTAMSKSIPAEDVLIFLNLLFSRFDKLANKYQTQKIDVIGDAYIVGSGILSPDDDGYLAVDKHHNAAHGAGKMMALAIEMHRAAFGVRMPDGKPVQVRIGLHTGPCVSGLLGCFNPKFSIFGDSVNTAARMEQTTEAQSIQLSSATYSLLPKDIGLDLVATGGVECKGKGMMDTWLWRFPDSWKQLITRKSEDTPPLPQACHELFKRCTNTNNHSQPLSTILPTLHLLPKVLQATSMLGGPAASEEDSPTHYQCASLQSPLQSRFSGESRHTRESHRRSPPLSTTQESRTAPVQNVSCEGQDVADSERSGRHSTEGSACHIAGQGAEGQGGRSMSRGGARQAVSGQGKQSGGVLCEWEQGQGPRVGSSTGGRALQRVTSLHSSDGGELGKSSDGGELGRSSAANAVYLPSFHGGFQGRMPSISRSQSSAGARSQDASIGDSSLGYASNRGLHSMGSQGRGLLRALSNKNSRARSGYFISPSFAALAPANSAKRNINSAGMNAFVAMAPASSTKRSINSAGMNARRTLLQEHAALLEAEIRPWSTAHSFRPAGITVPEEEPQSLQ